MQKHLYDDFSSRWSEEVTHVHQLCSEYLSNQLLNTDEIEDRKEFTIRIAHHITSIHPVIEAYEKLEAYINSFDVHIHFNFVTRLLLPIAQEMIKLDEGNSLRASDCYDALAIAIECQGSFFEAESWSGRALSTREKFIVIRLPIQKNVQRLLRR